METYRKELHTVSTPLSGYVQLILFNELIEEAQKDNILLKMEVRVGSFSYWGPGAGAIDESKYIQLIRIGHKETEIQDLKWIK
nr:DUF2254 family protein [Virgibacillus sp. Bac332]